MHTEFIFDSVLYTGRPADPREAQELLCYDLLERLEIPFDRVDHDPAMTIELCHEVEQILKAKICKNLFLCNRQKTEFYLLLMPGDKTFKTKFLSAQLGCSRLSFAEEDALWNLMKLRPGSATVFGLLNANAKNVHLVIDKDLISDSFFACHPCFNTSTVRFRTHDLLEKLLPALNVMPVFVDLPEADYE